MENNAPASVRTRHILNARHCDMRRQEDFYVLVLPWHFQICWKIHLQIIRNCVTLC